MRQVRSRRGRPAKPEHERLVGVNYTVSQAQRERLRALGEARGVPASTVLRELLDQCLAEESSPPTTPPEAVPQLATGRELVEELTANGMIGAWKDRTDIGDSVEFARKLRERVWTRTHD
jgi:hypothetical protein